MRYRHRNPHVVRAGKKFTFRRPDIAIGLGQAEQAQAGSFVLVRMHPPR
jgi:hypothetical protein